MDPLDAVIHLVNLFLPAAAVGAIAAAAAKLLWRQALRTASWARLAAWAAAAGSVVTLAGLLFFGHDGAMATYAGMVLAASLALMWAGFGRGRR